MSLEGNDHADIAYKRCVYYSARLEDSSLKRARGLLSIFNSSNQVDNPLRKLPGPDGKAVSINLMMSACLHETILIACAVLDTPRHGRPVLKSNMVSFPVIAELMRIEGVNDLRLADGDTEIKQSAQQRFFQRLGGLKLGDIGDRLTRVRDYRDQYLAHALDHDTDRPPPKMGDILELMDEACIISGDCQLALFGKRTTVNEDVVTVSESIEAVWRKIAA